MSGETLTVRFIVNVDKYKFAYYLTDEIYHAYATFVKAFRHLVEPRYNLFKRDKKERKDVERDFGVLK